MLLGARSAAAQPANPKAIFATVGAYNVENLYDTIPSLFYDDSDYTPSGRLGWGTQRYRTKLSNLARVIDDMNLDVLALAEVESEQALRDLVETLDTDYNYIHLTGGDRRGIDLALLYKGDKFVPSRSGLVNSASTREFLHVKGELCGHAVDIVVCHLPSRINTDRYRIGALRAMRSLADSLHRNNPAARLILLGDFNSVPSDKEMKNIMGTGRRAFDPAQRLFSPFVSLAAKGQGTYCYNNRWQMLDNIFLSVNLIGGGHIAYESSGIFIRRYMIASDIKSRNSYPRRTFTSGRYTAGYSDHLPLYVTLRIAQ